MTTKEFEAFTRGIAKSAVKYKLGMISADDLYEDLYLTLGKETFEETEQLLAQLKKK